MRRLSKKVGVPVPYVAVPEMRPSGLGYHAIPLHWHFLAACPEGLVASVTREASALWTRQYGNFLIQPYDPSRRGAYYIAKLASQAGFEYGLDNLDRLGNRAPDDFVAAVENNPYVPEHIKGINRYDTLVVRDFETKLPINSLNLESRSERSRPEMAQNL
jgi:hypothetical protein